MIWLGLHKSIVVIIVVARIVLGQEFELVCAHSGHTCTH